MLRMLFCLFLWCFGSVYTAEAQKPLQGNYCTEVMEDSTYYCFDFQQQQVQFHYNAPDYRTVGAGRYLLSADSLVLTIDSGILDKKNKVKVTDYDISYSDSNELNILLMGANDMSMERAEVSVYRTDAFGAVEMSIDTVYKAEVGVLSLKIAKEDAYYFIRIHKEGFQEYLQEYINDANRIVEITLHRSDYARRYAEGNIYKYQILSRTKNNLVLRNVVTERMLDLRLEKESVLEDEEAF